MPGYIGTTKTRSIKIAKDCSKFCQIWSHWKSSCSYPSRYGHIEAKCFLHFFSKLQSNKMLLRRESRVDDQSLVRRRRRQAVHRRCRQKHRLGFSFIDDLELDAVRDRAVANLGLGPQFASLDPRVCCRTGPPLTGRGLAPQRVAYFPEIWKI